MHVYIASKFVFYNLPYVNKNQLNIFYCTARKRTKHKVFQINLINDITTVIKKNNRQRQKNTVKEIRIYDISNYIHLFEMRGHYKLEYMIYPTIYAWSNYTFDTSYISSYC